MWREYQLGCCPASPLLGAGYVITFPKWVITIPKYVITMPKRLITFPKRLITMKRNQ